jgi:hypothetical protein
MFYYKENISLPELPSAFRKILLQNYTIQKDNHTHFISGKGHYRIKRVPDLIYNWVNQNICNSYDGLGIQSVEHGDFDPHIDGRSQIDPRERYFTLMYILESGGDGFTNPITRFYQVSSGTKKSDNNGKSIRLYNRKDLTVVTECEFKSHTWNLINNQCIHSVDNVKSRRTALALNFHYAQPQFLLDKGYI